MTPQQLQTVRRIHHEVAGQPRARPITLPAGDLLDLINALWAEEKRADVHAARFKQVMQRAVQERVDGLLLADRESAGGTPSTARATAASHAQVGAAAD